MILATLYTSAKYSIDRFNKPTFETTDEFFNPEELLHTFAPITATVNIFNDAQIHIEVNFIDEKCGPISVTLHKEHLLWLVLDNNSKNTKKGNDFKIIKNDDDTIQFDKQFAAIVRPLKLDFFQWNKFRWIIQCTLMDVSNMHSYITKKIHDYFTYQHIIIACAVHRYQVILNTACSLCADTNKQQQYDHSPNCFTHDKKLTRQQAKKALNSVTDARFAAILESNGIHAPQDFTVADIITNDRKNILAFILCQNSYLPASSHLIQVHVQMEREYYYSS